MFKWLIEKYQEWQFERAFRKRKKRNYEGRSFYLYHTRGQNDLDK